MAEAEDGKVGGGLFTSLMRKARNSTEVNDLIQEAEKRFGPKHIPWQTLSAAAYVSSGPLVNNPTLAMQLLQKIDPTRL